MSRDSIANVVFLIGILVVIVAGWQFAAASGAQSNRVVNETATVEANTSVALDTDAVRYSNTSVVVNGTSYTEGVEYELQQWNGRVTWTAAAAPENGEQAAISYDAEQQDDTTSGLQGLLTPLRALFPFLLFLGIAGAVVAMIDTTWGG